MSDSSLVEKVHSILKDRGYEKINDPLDYLAGTIDQNLKNALGKVTWYKWSGFFLLIAIPMLSTLLSIFVTEGSAETVVKALSYSLTLLTLFNSIFKPGERFRQACLMGIRIGTFRSSFLSELAQLEVVNDKSLLVLVERLNREFEQYQEQLIGLFLPESVLESAKAKT